MFIKHLDRSMKIGFAALVVSLGFFGWDILADIAEHIATHEQYSAAQLVHLGFEIVAFLSLLYALKMMKANQDLLMVRAESAETRVEVYRGGSDVLLTKRLDEVQLSQAEKEIALFILKGLSPAEIAELRGTAVGTVKTQTTSIYRKMQVKSRSELLSQLVEEILDFDELQKIVAEQANQ